MDLREECLRFTRYYATNSLLLHCERLLNVINLGCEERVKRRQEESASVQNIRNLQPV